MNNIMSLLPLLQNDPYKFLQQRGINIPPNLNDPNAIIQHLLNTGQVSQDQVNKAMSMRQAFMQR